MTNPWLYTLAFLLVANVLVFGLLLAARLVRVRARNDSPLRRQTYECGEEPEGSAWVRFHPRYYVVALFFVLFDVEAAFLFPWATAQKALGAGGFVAMLLFAAVLLLGWAYAVRKGALRWQ
jgi:NADH:ubiquinone oxidoreductase subunit 3 (subunit A)